MNVAVIFILDKAVTTPVLLFGLNIIRISQRFCFAISSFSSSRDFLISSSDFSPSFRRRLRLTNLLFSYCSFRALRSSSVFCLISSLSFSVSASFFTPPIDNKALLRAFIDCLTLEMLFSLRSFFSCLSLSAFSCLAFIASGDFLLDLFNFADFFAFMLFFAFFFILIMILNQTCYLEKGNETRYSLDL